MQNDDMLQATALPRLYLKTVLSYPALIVTILLVTLCFFIWQARHFALDASADALLLENDKDLQTYRGSTKRYASGDFLVVTYTPEEELFDHQTLNRLEKLRDDLTQVDTVESVFSLLEVPLLTSSGVSLSELSSSCLLYTSPSPRDRG